MVCISSNSLLSRRPLPRVLVWCDGNGCCKKLLFVAVRKGSGLAEGLAQESAGSDSKVSEEIDNFVALDDCRRIRSHRFMQVESVHKLDEALATILSLPTVERTQTATDLFTKFQRIG